MLPSKPQSRPHFIPGIDVSHWQGKIDWQRVRNVGVRFAFIKATEGVNREEGKKGVGFVDPKFSDNWRNAREAGVLRGAYHVFHPQINTPQQEKEQHDGQLLDDARRQAKLFLNKVRLDDGDLPPALQLETAYGITRDEMRRGVQVWINEVELITQRKVIIYAGVMFLQTNFPEWLAATGKAPRPLWITDTFEPRPDGPKLPEKRGHWDFWQYSVTGYVDGILVNTNLDWFNGSLPELIKLAHTKIEPQTHRSTAATAPAQAPLVQKTVHIVRQGENLDSIAKVYGVTVADLIRANRIDNPNLIPIGTRLNIPLKSPA